MSMRERNRAGVLRTVRTILSLAVIGLMAACGGNGSGESGASEEAGSGPAEAAAGAGAQGTQQPGEQQRFDITSLGFNVGDLDAPIRVVEFSDFTCPHCKAFHLESYPTLHDEYVETGQAVWKYIPFASGALPSSVHAARAGECAIELGGEAFPTLRDRIFEEQANWVNVSNPTSLMLEYAADEGLDVERLSSCIEEGRRDQNLQANIQIARQIGIQSTPSFIIGDVFIPGNQPIDAFRDVFDGIIAEERGEAPAAGDSN